MAGSSITRTNWTSIKPGWPFCIWKDKRHCGCLATAVILQWEQGTDWGINCKLFGHEHELSIFFNKTIYLTSKIISSKTAIFEINFKNFLLGLEQNLPLQHWWLDHQYQCVVQLLGGQQQDPLGRFEISLWGDYVWRTHHWWLGQKTVQGNINTF